MAQAERLARRLGREGVARIVSSDFARARTTAECLRRETGAPLSFEPLLQERSFGDLRGTPYVEIGFDMFEPDYAPPNGESGPSFTPASIGPGRACSSSGGDHGGHLAVVTHGLVCRSLATRHLTCRTAQVAPERWENTSLTVIDRPAPWRVRLLNCIAHLDDLDSRASADSAPV